MSTVSAVQDCVKMHFCKYWPFVSFSLINYAMIVQIFDMETSSSVTSSAF